MSAEAVSNAEALHRQVVFLFSGQGPQTYHMGRTLYEQHRGFRRWMNHLDSVVQRLRGDSVLERLYDSGRRKHQPFDDIEFSHPAIFMIEYALSQVLIEEHREPDFVLGASLGEFVAAAVAKAVGVEDALANVVESSSVLSRLDPTGGMIAVLGDRAIYDSCEDMRRDCEIAAVIGDTHFVVAGTEDELSRVVRHLDWGGVSWARLPVRHAFHSSRIDVLADKLANGSRAVTFRGPQIPVISCLTGGALERYPERFSWNVIRRPIEVRQALQYSERLGKCIYLDLGPGSSFVNFANQVFDRSRSQWVFPTLSPFDRDCGNLARIQALLGDIP